MGYIVMVLLAAHMLLTPHLPPSVSARWVGPDRAVITFAAPGCIKRLAADGTIDDLGCYTSAGSVALPADVALTPKAGDRYLFVDRYGGMVVAPLQAVVLLPRVTR